MYNEEELTAANSSRKGLLRAFGWGFIRISRYPNHKSFQIMVQVTNTRGRWLLIVTHDITYHYEVNVTTIESQLFLAH